MVLDRITRRLRQITLPVEEIKINKKEYDFSKGIRGKFFKKGAQFRLPICLSIRTTLTINNPLEKKLRALSVKALVDMHAPLLCVPEHIKVQLKLDELEKREVTTADGRKQLVSYVGPVQVRFKNRSCFVGALVLGDEVLLGSVPMEDMDLIVSPAHKMVIVNPDSPNFPHALVK